MTLPAAELTEESATHAGVRFKVVRVAPERVELMWKDAKGEPYRSFDRVQAVLAAQGKRARFLMNGGLFQPGGTPCGLYIERGAILRPLNLKDGAGNFHLKPNGVCWIESAGTTRRARVTAAETYQKYAAALPAGGAVRILTAVQSGPLLLADGVRHPKFTNGSPNKLHRNGVGVDDKGRLVFAMTDRDQRVNFWDFAGLFLNLGCRDALFLDGSLSQMAVNPDRPIPSNLFGSIFVVAE